VTQNAGGFGDPLDRPTSEVLHDVVGGHVTVDSARRLYGVHIADGVVDEAASEQERDELRKARSWAPTTSRDHYDTDADMPVVESWLGVLDLVRGPDGIMVRATDSGAVLGPLGTNWRDVARRGDCRPSRSAQPCASTTGSRSVSTWTRSPAARCGSMASGSATTT
jgi:N-methylhydantoinase B